MQGAEEREGERDRHRDTETQKERERETNRDGREGSASSSGASHRAPMDASLPPSVPLLPMGASLPPSVPSLPIERTASNGGISRLDAADPASDSDLPPDVGADAELLVVEGSASFSGMSWHGWLSLAALMSTSLRTLMF